MHQKSHVIFFGFFLFIRLFPAIFSEFYNLLLNFFYAHHTTISPPPPPTSGVSNSRRPGSETCRRMQKTTAAGCWTLTGKSGVLSGILLASTSVYFLRFIPRLLFSFLFEIQFLLPPFFLSILNVPFLLTCSFVRVNLSSYTYTPHLQKIAPQCH